MDKIIFAIMVPVIIYALKKEVDYQYRTNRA